MAQLEHIEAIEKRLWGAADTLRANSNYASNEYFLPVMGLIFLRHAYSRSLASKTRSKPPCRNAAGRRGRWPRRTFRRKPPSSSGPRPRSITWSRCPTPRIGSRPSSGRWRSIEADYENLRGVLPKSDYQELDNEVLGQLLRTLNPEELKRVSGDVFGRIYEYFLTQFDLERCWIRRRTEATSCLTSPT